MTQITTVDFIKKFYNYKCTGGSSEEEISLAEKNLNLKFSHEYREILKTFGAVMIGSHELNGITKTPGINVVRETESFRKLSDFSKDLYVIESLGIDFQYVLQNEQGEVFLGTPDKIEKIADSIWDYILLDFKKNMTVESVFDFLKRTKIPRFYYSLGYSEDAICIEKTENGWMVYNGERGSKFCKCIFDNERDACEKFFMRVIDLDY